MEAHAANDQETRKKDGLAPMVHDEAMLAARTKHAASLRAAREKQRSDAAAAGPSTTSLVKERVRNQSANAAAHLKLSEEQVLERRASDKIAWSLDLGSGVYCMFSKACKGKGGKMCPWCAACCKACKPPCSQHASQLRSRQRNAPD
jgi:hypothetical protein